MRQGDRRSQRHGDDQANTQRANLSLGLSFANLSDQSGIDSETLGNKAVF